jgi:hypothetical protein
MVFLLVKLFLIMEGYKRKKSIMNGLKNFTITTSDMSYFNLIKSNIQHDSLYEEQRRQITESNQFTVTDPNGIQIVIRID